MSLRMAHRMVRWIMQETLALYIRAREESLASSTLELAV